MHVFDDENELGIIPITKSILFGSLLETESLSESSKSCQEVGPSLLEGFERSLFASEEGVHTDTRSVEDNTSFNLSRGAA